MYTIRILQNIGSQYAIVAEEETHTDACLAQVLQLAEASDSVKRGYFDAEVIDMDGKELNFWTLIK